MLSDLATRAIDQPQSEQCQLQAIGPYEYSTSGAAFTKATVAQNGQVYKVKVYQGNGPQLIQAQIGHLLQFNLKSYQARNGQIYISGFWNDKATPQQMAQNTAQSAPRPVQSTNAPNTAQTTRNSGQVSTERQVCIKGVSRIAAARPEMDLSQAMEWAVVFHDWIATGKVNFDVTHEPVNAPPWDEGQGDEEPPF